MFFLQIGMIVSIKITTISGTVIRTDNIETAKEFWADGASVLDDNGNPINFYEIPSDPALDTNCDSCQ